MTHRAAIVFQDGVTQFIQVKKNERLLDAAFRHGISLPLDCREGVCATCRGLCESGDIAMEYVDEDALTEAEQAKGYMLPARLPSNPPLLFISIFHQPFVMLR
jgi:anthranilate 1,2-dioxygenase reductase subunit